MGARQSGARQSPAAATGKQPKEGVFNFSKKIRIFLEFDLTKLLYGLDYGWAGRKTLVHRTAGNFPAIFLTFGFYQHVREGIEHIY